jgi:hypothetical protein
MGRQLVVTLSHADRFGHYRVRAVCDGAEYLDFFNPANEWRRRTFAQNTLSAFGWTETPELVEEVMNAVLGELRQAEKGRELPEEVVETQSMSEVKANGMKWLWPGRIALGKLCVIAGDPGLGKSLLTLSIAAHASRGAPWPDETASSPLTSVLLLSAEDDFVDTPATGGGWRRSGASHRGEGRRFWERIEQDGTDARHCPGCREITRLDRALSCPEIAGD